MHNSWNNETLSYDIDKYPWDRWVLQATQKLYPDVYSLEEIHKVLAEHELFELTIHIQSLFGKQKLWMKRLSDFANDYIPELINTREFLIKRQPTLNLVIPNQESVGRRLPFHQGVFYDNGRGQGTIWMPLTETYSSNSMWVLSTEKSRSITKRVIKESWSVETFEKECLKYATPVTLKPGQAHLFNQEIIHGNVNNETKITRMALDWHVLPRGGEFYRRLPGGFFRHPDDFSQVESTDATNKRYICYVSNNHNLSKFWPKNFQRAIIDNYLKENNIKNNGYQFENEFLDHLPIFDHYLDQNIDGIVLCSIYQLPEVCDNLLQKALENKVVLHFANENLTLKTQDDLNYILMYRNWGHSKIGSFNWE